MSLSISRPPTPSKSSAPSAPSVDDLQIAKGHEILEFNGDDDAANPSNWSETRKWLICSTFLLGTGILSHNGTAMTVASLEIDEDFGVKGYRTFSNAYWPVTSWTLGGAFCVVLGLPILEDHVGIRKGYLAVYAFFLLMLIPQALAPDFATLIVSRFFSGGCVALLSNAIAALIPDMWNTPMARSLPISLYIWFYVVGDTSGPPVYAAVVQFIGNWRWIFYIQLAIYGALFPFFLLSVRETRKAVILRRRAKRIRTETGKAVYTKEELQQQLENNSHRQIIFSAMTRPLYLLFTEPVLFACSLWSAFCLGLVFLFTQSVGQVFTTLYGWQGYSTGYVQGAIVIGEAVGWVASLYGMRLFLNSKDRNTEMPGRPIPEARLYVSVFGSFFGIAGGMFVYAWTSYTSIPWIAPAIGLGMTGFGTQVVVHAVADYVTDAYAASGYNGSALAAVAFLENIVCGVLPLASQGMYTRLGFQWASSLIGCLALVLSLAPVIIIWKGRQLRERSPYMTSTNKQHEKRQWATVP